MKLEYELPYTSKSYDFRPCDGELHEICMRIISNHPSPGNKLQPPSGGNCCATVLVSHSSIAALLALIELFNV